MQVRFWKRESAWSLGPRARMEAADGDDFAAAVEQRLQPQTKSVTIDLEALDFISLAGIRAVLRLARSLKDGQRGLDFLQAATPCAKLCIRPG
jgi:anti-anti-sigma regulatory factor